MKRLILGLPLLALASAAQANTGTINFTGEILSGGTCPIEIIAPGGGSNGTVEMGEAYASDFRGAGTEHNNRTFNLRVTDPTQCTGWDPSNPDQNAAVVKFDGRHGGASGDTLFALNPDNSPAGGIALGIRDASGKLVGHGARSEEYALNASGNTDLNFTAHYRSTAATVTPGHANADVSLEVIVN
ncbi:fimbrial protein [Pseudomonas sp. NPDC007930]|uniref:fimbrial protein n=1 Tax=Pseudomonas sp. NPDC007930 TaxID=3364417 RepID=UPI0036EE8FF6